jgi:hypothetical protein
MGSFIRRAGDHRLLMLRPRDPYSTAPQSFSPFRSLILAQLFVAFHVTICYVTRARTTRRICVHQGSSKVTGSTEEWPMPNALVEVRANTVLVRTGTEIRRRRQTLGISQVALATKAAFIAMSSGEPSAANITLRSWRWMRSPPR